MQAKSGALMFSSNLIAAAAPEERSARMKKLLQRNSSGVRSVQKIFERSLENKREPQLIRKPWKQKYYKENLLFLSSQNQRRF